MSGRPCIGGASAKRQVNALHVDKLAFEGLGRLGCCGAWDASFQVGPRLGHVSSLRT